MTAHAEVPGREIDELVSRSALINFRDDVLVESVNFLANRNFIKAAKPDSVFCVSDKSPGDASGQVPALQVTLQAECRTPATAEDDNEIVISLWVSVAEPSLVPGAQDAFVADNGAEYADELSESQLQAWEVREYTFNTEFAEFSSALWLELSEADGDLWDSRDYDDGALDGDSDLLTKRVKLISDLEDQYKGSFEPGDLILIKAALVKLGVPGALLDGNKLSR